MADFDVRQQAGDIFLRAAPLKPGLPGRPLRLLHIPRGAEGEPNEIAAQAERMIFRTRDLLQQALDPQRTPFPSVDSEGNEMWLLGPIVVNIGSVRPGELVYMAGSCSDTKPGAQAVQKGSGSGPLPGEPSGSRGRSGNVSRR